MSTLSSANLADAPNQDVLENPCAYEIVGYCYAIEETPYGTLDLTLEQNNSICTLRFTGVCELEIDAGFPHSYMGLEILNVKHLGWDNIHVRVEGFETEAPGLRFWANTVFRLP